MWTLHFPIFKCTLQTFGFFALFSRVMCCYDQTCYITLYKRSMNSLVWVTPRKNWSPFQECLISTTYLFFKQRLIYLYTSKCMTSVSNLQILNPIWQACPAVLNCNLRIRQTLSLKFSASCPKHPAPPHTEYKEFISLTAPWILHSSQAGSQALRPKDSTSWASFTFSLKCFFIDIYLVQMASHKPVRKIIYFEVFHQEKLTKMTQFISKAILRQNMLVEKSNKSHIQKQLQTIVIFFLWRINFKSCKIGAKVFQH